MVSVAPLPGVCLSLCLSLCLSRDSPPPNWDRNSHHNRPQQPVFSPAGREKQTKTLRSLQNPIGVVTWAQKREQLWAIKSLAARLGGLASRRRSSFLRAAAPQTPLLLSGDLSRKGCTTGSSGGPVCDEHTRPHVWEKDVRTHALMRSDQNAIEAVGERAMRRLCMLALLSW